MVSFLELILGSSSVFKVLPRMLDKSDLVAKINIKVKGDRV